MSLEILGIGLLVFAVGSHLLAGVSLIWMHKKRRPKAEKLPFVSILKPLKGIDDQLEPNLASFFTLNYPKYEILFCAADHHDPALEVARSVAAQHPHVPCHILSGAAKEGLNPKVRVLEKMTGRACGELLLISDSNVRVRPDYLLETAEPFEDPEVAVVSNLVAGVGEKSLGATLENLQLNGFIAPVISMGVSLRIASCLVGKSMLLRRSDLEAVGGWKALNGVLAEDFLLGQLLLARRRKAVICNHVVETVNETWSFRRFVERHDRWLKMRWRISPRATTFEMMSNVTMVALFSVALASGSALSLWAAAAGIGARMAVELVATGTHRGFGLRKLAPVALVPLRDVILAALWVHARLSAKIRWREGETLVVGHQTRLFRPGGHPIEAAVAPALVVEGFGPLDPTPATERTDAPDDPRRTLPVSLS